VGIPQFLPPLIGAEQKTVKLLWVAYLSSDANLLLIKLGKKKRKKKRKQKIP
jgi:hypothetical protein